MKLDLSGKVALITGGARGIGRECARALARAGATIIINFSRSREKAEGLLKDLKSENLDGDMFRADISSPPEIEKMFSFISQEHRKLDIVVNNAGILRDRLLLEVHISDWDRLFDVNLKGAFLVSQKAIGMMLPAHRGKIINIASVSAIRGGKGQSNYAAAKGGLISFSRACAVELGRKNIQVNAVLPGLIVTEMSERVRRKADKKLLEKIPAARYGTPSDVAGLVVFLASDQSDYITGQAICVDGGLSIS